MTYQQTTAVVDLAVITALVSLSFYCFSSAVALTTAVAMVSLAEMMVVDLAVVTALALSSSYFFSSAVMVLEMAPDATLDVAAAANNNFIKGRFSTTAHAEQGTLRSPYFLSLNRMIRMLLIYLYGSRYS